MKTSPVDKAFILSNCESLQAELSENVTWRWDDHFSALLAEFSVDHEARVMMNAKHLFPHVWDKKSIKQAPGYLIHRAGGFGQLNQEQKLLTQDTDGQSELMAAWWPWGHGATVSLRIFRANQAIYVPQRGVWARIKSWF